MTDAVLRAAIIEEMKSRRAKSSSQFGTEDIAKWPDRFSYCTWWFKSAIKRPTREIRRELDRMERDGVIRRGLESTSNNTHWVLLEPAL